MGPDSGPLWTGSLWERLLLFSISAFVSESIYMGDKEARPDGIWHKLFLQD